MTDDNGSHAASQYRPGDVANGHILTEAGWLPLRHRPRDLPGPYYAGDLIDGHAFTGSGWVSVPIDEAARVSWAGTAPLATTPIRAPKRSTGRAWLVALVICVAVLVALGVVGIVAGNLVDTTAFTTAHQSRTASPKDANSTPSRPVKTSDPTAKWDKLTAKEGFTKMGKGLYVDVLAGQSDGYSTTWRVGVISFGGCPNGVYVEGRVTDANGVVVGSANGALLSLPAKTGGIIEVSLMSSGEDRKFTLNKADCF